MVSLKRGKQWAKDSLECIQLRVESRGLTEDEAVLNVLQQKYSAFGRVVIAGRLMQLPFLVEMGSEVKKLTQELARLRHGKWLETDFVTPADSADEVLTIAEEIYKVGTPLSEESPASDQFGSITLMDGNVIPERNEEEQEEDRKQEIPNKEESPKAEKEENKNTKKKEEVVPQQQPKKDNKEKKEEEVPQQQQKTHKEKKEEAPRNKKRRCPKSGCAFYGLTLRGI